MSKIIILDTGLLVAYLKNYSPFSLINFIK